MSTAKVLPGEAVVGARDDTNPAGFGMCGATWDGQHRVGAHQIGRPFDSDIPWTCTRPYSHKLDHAAGDGDVVCAVWPAEDVQR